MCGAQVEGKWAAGCPTKAIHEPEWARYILWYQSKLCMYDLVGSTCHEFLPGKSQESENRQENTTATIYMSKTNRIHTGCVRSGFFADGHSVAFCARLWWCRSNVIRKGCNKSKHCWPKTAIDITSKSLCSSTKFLDTTNIDWTFTQDSRTHILERFLVGLRPWLFQLWSFDLPHAKLATRWWLDVVHPKTFLQV